MLAATPPEWLAATAERPIVEMRDDTVDLGDGVCEHDSTGFPTCRVAITAQACRAMLN